ncbi:hypothetical protein, partial [Mesorhizobium sp. M5C.F.Ca.IN.020.29.1.1]|uniref:hypothetical protein n=1 Tax=Mesorhizobium sp. M5C.F.Ca.IN.020.29.1.1 TaxID=2496770 RepID=UPI001FE068F7
AYPAIMAGTASIIRINRHKISRLIGPDLVSGCDNNAAVLVTETDRIAFIAVAQIEGSICPADPAEFDSYSHEVWWEVLAQRIAR